MKKTLDFCLLIILLVAVVPAQAKDGDYIYCLYKEFNTIDSDDRRVFYSAVFLGDYSFTTGYTNDFRDFLKDKHDFNGISKYCFFEGNSPAASRELEGRMRDDERTGLYGGGVIMTNWAPDTFDEQSIQDFNITISGDSAQLRVCVRDHECEDGDKVRLRVDGSQIFSGEIDNDWDCDTFTVQANREYAVELYAINGSGNKGNCSYANVNTGELRVEGSNTEVQSWQHRGGAGSRAHIIVKPK